MDRITQLEYDLTIATDRVPGARSVAIGVWVGIGSRDEPADRSGVSHFLEHLLFKGTQTRSATDISRTVDRVGGDIPWRRPGRRPRPWPPPSSVSHCIVIEPVRGSEGASGSERPATPGLRGRGTQ